LIAKSLKLLLISASYRLARLNAEFRLLETMILATVHKTATYFYSN